MIANDFSRELYRETTPNIHFKPIVFADQNLALLALTQGSIDVFVTSGGGVEVEYLVGNPDLVVIAQLRTHHVGHDTGCLCTKMPCWPVFWNAT